MYQNIVFITDNVKSKIIDSKNRYLEGNTPEQNHRMMQSLSAIKHKVHHYTSIDKFQKHINEHKNDIILPLLFGGNSCNQKTLLPSLCEINNLNYIGADPYTHTLCNDKHLSKLYAKHFGIHSAKDIVIYPNEKDKIADKLKYLKFPVIVKPNFGGGSVGITSENIKGSIPETVSFVKKLIKRFKMAILIEEIIEGVEVELILLGNSKQILISEEVQLCMGEKRKYKEEIWGLETKKLDDTSINFEISHFISKEDRENLIDLFKSFQKLEFARFDGRVHNGIFYLIELSPDCYLGDDCAYYYAFQQLGYSHSEMFELLIDNALSQLENPNHR